MRVLQLGGPLCLLVSSLIDPLPSSENTKMAESMRAKGTGGGADSVTPPVTPTRYKGGHFGAIGGTEGLSVELANRGSDSRSG